MGLLAELVARGHRTLVFSQSRVMCAAPRCGRAAPAVVALRLLAAGLRPCLAERQRRWPRPAVPHYAPLCPCPCPVSAGSISWRRQSRARAGATAASTAPSPAPPVRRARGLGLGPGPWTAGLRGEHVARNGLQALSPNCRSPVRLAPTAEREERVRRFQTTPTIPVFLLTSQARAGAVGPAWLCPELRPAWRGTQRCCCWLSPAALRPTPALPGCPPGVHRRWAGWG